MEAFRFEHPEYLYGFLILPVLFLLFLLFLLGWRIKRKKFGDEALVKRLVPDLSIGKYWFRFILRTLALAAIILGVANLQIGSKTEEVKREGVDIMVALDVSRSMEATDVQPSRLESAKRFISRLLEELANDRIGLIIFAGNAYIQMPITSDYSAAKLFLSSISTEIVPTQGTAIGEAIRLAERSYVKGDEKHKVLVIISDGENHEGDAIEAAKEAGEKGVTIYTLGVGSREGAPIPVYRNGRRIDFVKDKEGKVVVSKTDPSMLKTIAGTGGGDYFNITGTQRTVSKLITEINTLEKKEFEARVYTDYDDKFQYFIGFAFFLLLIEFLISDKKSILAKKIRLFG